MKTIFIYLILLLTVQLSAQKNTLLVNGVGPFNPCPIGDPANPNPPNNAVNVPTDIGLLSWTNSYGALKNKVYFGSNQYTMSLIHQDSLVSSVTLPGLGPSSTYYWKVIEQNDTCEIPGPLWNFTTEDWVPGWLHDPFDQFNWICIGPSGLTNWNVNNSSNAGGWAPELRFNYSPSFIGQSILLSPLLHDYGGCPIDVQFWHMIDHYGSGYTLSAGYTLDGGITLNQVWSVTPNGNVGPEPIMLWFNPPNVDFQWYFMLEGDSYQINYWYIDEFCLRCILGPYILSPYNLAAQLVNNPYDVKLTWQDISNNEANFVVWRKTGPPSFPYDQLAVLPANTTEYIDTTVYSDSTYSYTMTAIDGECSSLFCSAVTITIPVPVELTSFYSLTELNNVLLNWSTSTETNNKVFEIERCEFINGQKEFKRIGSIEGEGTTTEKQNYSYIDKNLKPGTYLYRLKQIDYDGTYEYSYEVEAVVEVPSEFSLDQNYPNPFNPSTTISFGLPADSKVVLKIYNVLGEEIVTLVNGSLPAGLHKTEFDASNLNSGVYFYRINAKGADGSSFTSVKKMIINK